MINIMIIDDEPLVRASLQSFLNWEDHGFSFVCEASDGEEALEELDKHHVDLILLDIFMPRMDGLEFLEELEGKSDPPKVIVLSANDHYNSVRRAFQLGALDYILKADLDENTLLELLNKKKEDLGLEHEGPRRLSIKDGEYLKQRLLLDLMEMKNPELTLSMLKDLEIDIRFPMRICYLWADTTLEYHLLDLLRLNAAQHLKKRKAGGTYFISQEGQIFFLLDVVKNTENAMLFCDSFCRDFIEIIRDGMDLVLDYALSSQCEEMAELPSQFKYTLSLKSIESRMIRRAKKYMKQNFKSPVLSLGEVSEFVQISKAHLSAQFSKETGITFRDYLIQIRIDEAKKLLTETNLKVYEISEMVGYPNVEHFSRIFKKTVGTTANRYGRTENK